MIKFREEIKIPYLDTIIQLRSFFALITKPSNQLLPILDFSQRHVLNLWQILGYFFKLILVNGMR